MKRVILALLIAMVSQANAEDIPPMASKNGDVWCRAYVEGNLKNFQDLLAMHVAMGHWIVTAIPVTIVANPYTEYHLYVCSKRP